MKKLFTIFLLLVGVLIFPLFSPKDLMMTHYVIYSLLIGVPLVVIMMFLV